MCTCIWTQRWAQYICNYESNAPSPRWLCGNSCTWACDAFDIWCTHAKIEQNKQKST